MELGKYNVRVSILLAMAEIYGTTVQEFFAGLQLYE
jgi:hypothetical protein